MATASKRSTSGNRVKNPVEVEPSESGMIGAAVAIDPAAAAEAAAAREAAAKELAPKVEALLMSVDRAIPTDRIAVAIGLVPEDAQVADDHVLRPPMDAKAREDALATVDEAISQLNAAYEQTGRHS